MHNQTTLTDYADTLTPPHTDTTTTEITSTHSTSTTHSTTAPPTPAIRQELNTHLNELFNAADTDRATSHVTAYLTHSNDIAITQYSDRQRQGLRRQYLKLSPDWMYTRHWGTRSEWPAHGRHVPDDATPFHVPHENTGAIKDVFAYPQTTALPTDTDTDADSDTTTGTSGGAGTELSPFTPIRPIVENTTSTDSTRLRDAVITAAENDDIPGFSPVTVVTATIADTGLASRGLSHDGHITVRCSLSPVQQIRTLVHELAHEYLQHHSHAFPKGHEEIEAEAVAYLVTTHLGLTVSQSNLYVRRFRWHYTARHTDESRSPTARSIIADADRRDDIITAAEAISHGIKQHMDA